MPEAVIMPKLEMDMEDAVLVGWLKQEGEPIESGEPLFEIETAKAVVEVEAELSGVLLKQLFAVGATVPVTQNIGWIGQPGETVPDATVSASFESISPTSGSPSSSPADAVDDGTPALCDPVEHGSSGCPATPAAKRLALQHGLDLSTVRPTGVHGEIKLRDVEAAVALGVGTIVSSDASAIAGSVKATPLARRVAESQSIDLRTVAGSGFGGKIFQRDLFSSQSGATKQCTQANQANSDRSEPLSSLRRIIAKRMTESACGIPQATVEMSVDVTELLALREKLAGVSAERLSVNVFVAYAAVLALLDTPGCNASLDGDSIRYFGDVHLGIAAATPRGLLVPVVRGADAMTLQQLSREIRRLATGARENKLMPSELSGSTFTISNLGMYGVTGFTPVLNPPESAILGVCGIEDYPALSDGQWTVRKRMNLCLTIDHRVLDGVVAAEFLAETRRLLENPILLVMNQPWENPQDD